VTTNSRSRGTPFLAMRPPQGEGSISGQPSPAGGQQ
jgi:hypothetical protein